MSGTPLPLVSSIGVTPSAWNNWKLVPAGKLLVGRVMSKLSGALPLLRTTLVKVTVLPCAALATVWPVIVTAGTALTVNAKVLLLTGPTLAAPSL